MTDVVLVMGLVRRYNTSGKGLVVYNRDSVAGIERLSVEEGCIRGLNPPVSSSDLAM